MVLEFYKNIITELKKADQLILLVVLNSEGSSPGRKGFLMYVSSENMAGSIGGGIMEHKLVEMSKVWLQNGPFHPFIKHQVHQSDAPQHKSGMICSGKQTIAMYYLDKTDIPTAERIVQHPDAVIRYSQSGIDVVFSDDACLSAVINNDESWTLTQPISSRNKVYILGGGHVSLALSEVLSRLDFEIHLLDHRVGLNTLMDNAFAVSKKIIDLQDCHLFIPEGLKVYVVIMSFGYRTDKIILKALMGKKFRFLGMMGSQKKTEILLNELRDEGYPEAELQQVYAPVGLDIKSETPQEIAISVAAQLIRIKNRDVLQKS